MGEGARALEESLIGWAAPAATRLESRAQQIDNC